MIKLFLSQIILGLLYMPLEAQEASIFLEPKFSNRQQNLSIEISSDPPLSDCSFALYAAGNKNKLLRKLYTTNLIATSDIFTSETLVSAEKIKPLREARYFSRRSSRSIRSSENVFLRAQITCADGAYFSNAQKLKLSRRSRKGPERISSWISELKKKVSSGSVNLAEAFPALTFSSPIDLQSRSGSNKLFVVEQAGVIKSFDNSASTTTTQTFLDITSKVKSGGEQGLLGLTFHPNFQQNGYIYVNYTIKNSGNTIIARYTSTGENGTADPNSELVLMEVAQPFDNHNGGQLAFGQDGFLYISLGDGGSGGDPQGNGQSRTTLLGKILRIDVDNTSPGLNYSVPASNPFVGNGQGFLPEIYAYGLRNPWRFSFDSSTGQLWAADVGQGAREEINIITSGGNYGWNTREGKICYGANNCSSEGLIDPVHDYPRSEGQSVTGGYVYRGTNVPALNGFYIYGDFASGKIWSLKKEGAKALNTELFDSDYRISAFGVDGNKELYLLDYSSGKIIKFVNQ